jgi:hypothetical protein
MLVARCAQPNYNTSLSTIQIDVPLVKYEYLNLSIPIQKDVGRVA